MYNAYTYIFTYIHVEAVASMHHATENDIMASIGNFLRNTSRK